MQVIPFLEHFSKGIILKISFRSCGLLADFLLFGRFTGGVFFSERHMAKLIEIFECKSREIGWRSGGRREPGSSGSLF